MKKTAALFPLVFVFIIISCVTAAPSGEAPAEKETGAVTQAVPTTDSIAYDTRPVEKRFVFAAFSPRFQYDDDEVRYALANAARQFSIYRGARVRFARVIDENIIGTVQDQKVEIIYDRDLALSFLGDLKIEAENREPDHYAALVTLEGIAAPDYPVLEENGGSSPLWITRTPDIAGFVFGVGASGRLRTPYESWEEADKAAMAEIANYFEMNVYAGSATIERGGDSYSESTGVIKSLNWSDVRIEGLYILSRWREPDKSSYYSLAVVKKP